MNAYVRIYYDFTSGQERFGCTFRNLQQRNEGIRSMLMKRLSAGLKAAMEAKTSTKEKQEERAREEPFESQKMEALGNLAGRIAHDFNNTLQGILGYASLLKMKLHKTDPNYEAVSVIEASVEKAGELTRQLLDFAHKGTYVSGPLDLNSMVKEVCKTVIGDFDRSIEIRTALEENLQTVQGDCSQLKRVLSNICLNARDAMPSGGVLEIRTLNADFRGSDSSEPAPPGRYAAVRVSDTGTGMTDDLLRHIFEPFFTTKEKGKRAGMGLAVVYGIIKKHGGFVVVSSETGKGSTFTVYLPAVRIKTETSSA